MIRRPPRSPLFPYTPLSRSRIGGAAGVAEIERAVRAAGEVEHVTVGGEERRPAPGAGALPAAPERSEEHTSELQSQSNLVCRLLLEKKKKTRYDHLRFDLAP